MSRPPKFNIVTDDFMEVAEHVKLAVLHGGICAVYVDDAGAVRVMPPRTTPDPRPAHEMIGRYSRKTPIEVIEGDLLERAREINALAIPASPRKSKKQTRAVSYG